VAPLASTMLAFDPAVEQATDPTAERGDRERSRVRTGRSAF